MAPAPWKAVAAIGVGAFALVTAEFLPVGLLPQIAHELAITDGQAGLMITVPGTVAACSALLTISLARSFDRGLVLCFLLCLMVVSNAVVACAGGLYTLLLGRVLLGAAVGGFWTIGVSVGPRLRPDAVARATSIIFSGVTLGIVAGVPAGTFLGGLLGWRLAFGVSAALGAGVVVALIRLLPAIRPEPSSGLADLPATLRLPKVRMGLVAAVFIFIGQFGAYTYVAPYLTQISSIAPHAVSAVLSAYGIAGIFGNVMCGWIVGRHVRLAMLGTSLLLAVSMSLLLLSKASPVVAVGAMIAWGTAFGMLPIAMQSWIFTAAPGRLESAAALFVSVTQLAMGGGALIGGIAVDHYGIQSALWLGALASSAAAIWIYAGFPGRHPLV